MDTQQTSHKIRNTMFLFLTALIWGVAFVAQSVSMDYIEPFTFICLRSVIGGFFLIPCIWFFNRGKEKQQEKNVVRSLPWWRDGQLLRGGVVCGLFLFAANCFQQTGIQYTTVGKAGFITAFYIIIVPILGIFRKRFCGLLTWIAVVLALAGLYFLCIDEQLQIQTGDFLILISAFLFAEQIMAIDYYVQFVDAIKMSCIQFFTGAILGGIGMCLFETPRWSAIAAAAVPVLYTGIMSTGVAYTLQMVGQKGMNPTMAALILSLESVFSALAGFVILHQVLSLRELFGCALMFVAIVLAQLPDFPGKKD
ncbi:MAG: DMT family transporter [Eubacteriales bacterium]|nr:DMT family transporter [Eubacteriales bacterium]